MSTTTVRPHTYRPDPATLPQRTQPIPCECGRLCPDLVDLFGHDCPSDIRLSGAHHASAEAPRPLPRGNGTGRRTARPAAAPPCRPNRYAASCTDCGATVPAGQGLLCRSDGRWLVSHQPGQCSPAQAPTAPSPVPVADGPAAGHYAIVSTGDNDLAFYRVDRPTEGDYAGRVFVKLIVGGHPDRNVRRDHVAGILARIAADPHAAARYGQQIGRCHVCNRTLTDQASRAAGIGPECAKGGRS